jgi:hypothetical protein
MRRRDLLKSALPSALAIMLPRGARGEAPQEPTLMSDRAFWLEQMQRVAHPVLEALSERRLKLLMPIEAAKGQEESRRHTTYLEAFGRLSCGIAPWLEHGPTAGAEGALRSHYIALTQQALAAGVDPKSADFLDFGSNRQNIVDAAFLALAMLRAPKVLNAQLEARVRGQLADGLRATRKLSTPFNNWLLFSAAVEVGLRELGEPWDRMRVDYALRELASWYLGDGVYGDGPHFHFDYYDSFVMHPFLLAVLNAVSSEDPAWAAMLPVERERAKRYAQIQERMIAPDGSYPVVGRSITYRCGAFHALADVTLRGELAEDLPPEQVRCAMAATIRRTLLPAGTFDSNGWLQIGLAGHQPELGEPYISTGSLYLCASAFLPLGLPAEDRFWAGPETLWTAQKAWSGADVPADHALN